MSLSSFNVGLPSTTDSKFIKQLRELQESQLIDRIPLIPSTPEEMADMLKLCSYVRFKVPQQVRSPGWLQQLGKGGLRGGEGFASPGACTMGGEVVPGVQPALPFPCHPGGTPRAPLPSLSLQTHFSHSLCQCPLKFLLSRGLWQPAGMSKGFFKQIWLAGSIK